MAYLLAIKSDRSGALTFMSHSGAPYCEGDGTQRQNGGRHGAHRQAVRVGRLAGSGPGGRPGRCRREAACAVSAPSFPLLPGVELIVTASEMAWVTGHLAPLRFHHLGGGSHFHLVQRKKLRPRGFFGLRPGRWDQEWWGLTGLRGSQAALAAPAFACEV